MKNWNRSVVTGSLLALGLLAGCIGRVRQPEINLTGVRLSGLGLRGGSLLAELEIKNPNGFDVETRSITYDLQVSDRDAENKETWIQFAKGTLEDKIKVADHGTTKVQIPIEFKYDAVSGALRSIMDRGTFNYRVEGTVALKEPLSRSIPYRHSGNISLQGAR
jgi:LEA14-like dessication related protein